MLGKALLINERNLGKDHADTGLLAGSLATLYCHQKRFLEAEPLLKKAAYVRELNFGPDDLTLGVLLAEYACALRGNENFSKAAKAEVRSTRIRVRSALRSGAAQN